MPQNNKNRNQNQNKNKNKNKNKSKSKQNTKTPKVDIYDPQTLLGGDDLRKFVKSQVRAEVRPQIKAAQRQKKELERVLSQQVGQQTALGQQASGNIAGFYRQMAEHEAQNLAQTKVLGERLSGAVSGAGASAQAGLNTAASSAHGQLDRDEALRQNAPSAARDELQSMIVAQQGRMGAEGQTLQASAAGQSADWQQALMLAGQANQMRGGEIILDTNREISNRITDLQNTYNPDIKDAIGNIKDIRGMKGALTNKLLGEMRGTEREYGLSKAALGIDRKSLKADAVSDSSNLKVAKTYGKNALREKKASLAAQLKVIKAQSGAKAREQAKTLQNQLDVIEAQIKATDKKQAGSQAIVDSMGGSNKGKLAQFDSKQKSDARQYVKRTYSKDPGYLDLPAHRQKLINHLHKTYRVNPILSKHFIKEFMKKRRKSIDDSKWNI